MPQLEVPGIVPDTRAEVNPVSVPSIPVDANAFGGAVGQAFSQMGLGLDRDSNELWSQAVNLQKQQNETEANNSLAGQMQETGLESERFLTQEGLNAGPAAFEAHVRRLNDIRQKYRTQLTNPDAQRQFDSTSVRFLGSEIRTAAGHSARQVKAASDASNNAIVERSIAHTVANPEDDQIFRQNKAISDAAIRRYARDKGLDEQATQNLIEKKDSHAIAGRVEGLVDKGKGDAAQVFSDKHKDAFTPDDQDKVDKALRRSRLTTGAVYAADQVLQEGLAKGENTEALQKRGAALSEKQFPGDKEFSKAVTGQIDVRLDQMQKAQRDKEHNARNIIDTMRANDVPIDHIANTPEGRQALNDLSGPEKFAMTVKNNRDIQDRNLTRIMGMLNNHDDEVKAAAMGIDVSKEPLTEAGRRQVNAKREFILKHPQDEDPRAHRAMNWFQSTYGAQMSALGIDKRSNNEDLYDRFMGTLSQAIEDTQKASGKPVDYATWKKVIAPMMIDLHTHENWHSKWGFGEPSVGDKQPDIPEDYRKAITEANTQEGGEPLTNEQLRQLYNQRLIQRLYPPKSSTPQPGTPNAPSR